LGINRKGDVPGSEIPGIYFDYLRTGDARGLQPVFYHNALDIITLAALTAELARVIGAEGSLGSPGAAERMHGLDLFSLSRIFERAGDTEKSVSVCRRALDSGLPSSFEPRALWHLATQHKRRREYDQAVKIWEEIARRRGWLFVEALEQLAIHAEHRRLDACAAIQFTERALAWLDDSSRSRPDDRRGTWNAVGHSERRTDVERFSYRLARLKRKAVKSSPAAALGLRITGS
jgi:tetratricopeptide (TPR) repeat protein